MISIVGLGKAGKALLSNFKSHNIEIDSIYDIDEGYGKKIAKKYNVKFKDINLINSEIVFIAVPDKDIERVSKMLNSKDFHIHLSGYYESSILSSKKKLSFHPNTPLNENVSLENTFIDLEGDTEFGRKICNQLKASYLEITPEEKKNLHLSAVIASNFFLALMYMSKTIFPKEWEKISKSLVLNTYNNIIQKGFEKALTGPVRRGDLEVIEKEREIFSKYFSTELYDEFIQTLRKLSSKEV